MSEFIVKGFFPVTCDHEWDNGSYHGKWERVVTFNCLKCGTHVACSVSDPDDGVVCDDKSKVCYHCNEPEDECYCEICTRCDELVEDSDYCERCDSVEVTA